MRKVPVNPRLNKASLAYQKRAKEIGILTVQLAKKRADHKKATIQDFGIADGDTISVGAFVAAIAKIVPMVSK